MSVASKSAICNLALSRLGNFGDVSDIDTPNTEQEKVFSKWYNTVRQKVLKSMIPNFATRRRTVAQLAQAPVFGYSYAYEYPDNCLKVLGIGEVKNKENDYGVENNTIMSNENATAGLKIRYIFDEEDVTKFTDDFVMLFSWELANNVCMEITQDLERQAYIEKILPRKRSEVGAVDSQENKPIRVNRSKFRNARVQDVPTTTDKR